MESYSDFHVVFSAFGSPGELIEKWSSRFLYSIQSCCCAKRGRERNSRHIAATSRTERIGDIPPPAVARAGAIVAENRGADNFASSGYGRVPEDACQNGLRT